MGYGEGTLTTMLYVLLLGLTVAALQQSPVDHKQFTEDHQQFITDHKQLTSDKKKLIADQKQFTEYHRERTQYQQRLPAYHQNVLENQQDHQQLTPGPQEFSLNQQLHVLSEDQLISNRHYPKENNNITRSKMESNEGTFTRNYVITSPKYDNLQIAAHGDINKRTNEPNEDSRYVIWVMQRKRWLHLMLQKYRQNSERVPESVQIVDLQ